MPEHAAGLGSSWSGPRVWPESTALFQLSSHRQNQAQSSVIPTAPRSRLCSLGLIKSSDPAPNRTESTSHQGCDLRPHVCLSRFAGPRQEGCLRAAWRLAGWGRWPEAACLRASPATQHATARLHHPPGIALVTRHPGNASPACSPAVSPWTLQPRQLLHPICSSLLKNQPLTCPLPSAPLTAAGIPPPARPWPFLAA